MDYRNFYRIFFIILLFQSEFCLAQNSLIEKVEGSWRSFASCKANVLNDTELARDIYQSDRTSAAKAEAYLRDYSISNFGQADARKLESGAYLRAAFEVYKPDSKTYDQLSLSERRERLKYCRGFFEHFANAANR